MRALGVMIICALLPLAAMAKPLSADIATNRIELHASFSGTDLLLFGARNEPGDIVVAVRGPTRNMLVRQKERIAGMWMYVRKAKYDALPQYFALASTLPLARIDDEGLFSQLSITPKEMIAQHTSASTPDVFNDAVLRLKERARLYTLEPLPITFFGETLFKTRIPFPDTMPRGTYVAEIYLIDEGQLIATQSLPLTAVKTGFEAWISDLAHERPLIYGLMSILIALSGGWIAHRVFRKR